MYFSLPSLCRYKTDGPPSRLYQSAPDLRPLGAREGRGRAGSQGRAPALAQVHLGVQHSPILGVQVDLGASTTHSELGPGQLVIARPLALGHRRARQRAIVRYCSYLYFYFYSCFLSYIIYSCSYSY